MTIDILSKRFWYFLFSLILIIPDLSFSRQGYAYGIDFTGGTMMELQFSQGNRPERELSKTKLLITELMRPSSYPAKIMVYSSSLS
jgi:preprotein translocase subunit SecF